MTKGAKSQGRSVGGMSTRAASWLAWSVWVSTLVAMALTFLLASLSVPTSSALVTACLSVVIVAFSTVGALVASRRPENPPSAGSFAAEPSSGGWENSP